MHSCEIIYAIAGNKPVYGTEKGICRVTGKESEGLNFKKWVRDTFTDIQSLKDGTIVSNAALFCFDEASEAVAHRSGKFYTSIEMLFEQQQKKVVDWQNKKKTKKLPLPKDIGYKQIPEGFIALQHFRTYSHIVAESQWYALTKADKRLMYELITTKNPDVVCLSESGQKHLIFKNTSGIWQLEDMQLKPDIEMLIYLHTCFSDLLELGFSQTEIITGNYQYYKIDKAGLSAWREKDLCIRSHRGSRIFQFASFLMFNHNTEK